MSMENGKWANSQDTLGAYRPPLLSPSQIPLRSREEGRTSSPHPGLTMGTQFKKPDSRKAKARPATLTKHNFPNAVKTSQESVTSSHPPKNKSALPPLESAVIARIIFSYNNTIRNLLENEDHDSLNGKLTKPIIPTADDEENNTAADSRNDRTMAHLMLETFLQLRENYHGSPSFIKQHEENIIATAHEILALFHKSPEPEQIECQSNMSYTSVGNLADPEL